VHNENGGAVCVFGNLQEKSLSNGRCGRMSTTPKFRYLEM